MRDWFHKHNIYSDLEAFETVKELREGKLRWQEAFGGDPRRRRAALKHLSFRLSCRPLLKFLYMYVGRLGLLDGGPGLVYCLLQTIYEIMIVSKVEELRRRERGLRV